MRIRSPTTPEDFEKYYRLRYEVLRQSWQQLGGSEKPVSRSALMALQDRKMQ